VRLPDFCEDLGNQVFWNCGRLFQGFAESRSFQAERRLIRRKISPAVTAAPQVQLEPPAVDRQGTRPGAGAGAGVEAFVKQFQRFPAIHRLTPISRKILP
jgi:hypothetical protein